MSTIMPPGNRRGRKPRHRAIALEPERRYRTIEGLEVRESRTDPSGDTVDIVGTPIVYDQAYVVRDLMGEFSETMRPGVATHALANGADVRYLLNHDGMPMARTASGTLRFEDTAKALRCIATLDLRQRLSADYVIAVERGDLSQMSCGFTVARDLWNEDMDEREVLQFASFLDVSGVTYPASPTTTLEVAQRMIASLPVESRARLRKLTVDLRAGKVLSSANQAKLADAVTSLHSILASSGVNPASLLDGAAGEDGSDPDDMADVDGDDIGNVNYFDDQDDSDDPAENPDDDQSDDSDDDETDDDDLVDDSTTDDEGVDEGDGNVLRLDDPGGVVDRSEKAPAAPKLMTLRAQIGARKTRRI